MSDSKPKLVFVTVGTTKFEKLIQAILQKDILSILVSLGYKKLKIQTGSETISPNARSEAHPELEIERVRYVEDFEAQLEEADLIVCHAGAGTCLEVLRKGKPAIVVINEDLMDNHQTELAKQLDSCGYVYCCNCESLKETLRKDVGLLKGYPKADGENFVKYLDRCMGFV